MEVRTLTFPRDTRSEVKRGTDGFLRVSVFLFLKISVCVCVLLDLFLGALALFFFASPFPSSLFQTEEKHTLLFLHPRTYTLLIFYRYLFVYSGFLFFIFYWSVRIDLVETI